MIMKLVIQFEFLSKRDYRELPSPDEAKSKEKAKKRPANDAVII